ncbi:NAD(P)-binding domain-containing protein [Brucella pituitosa]|uniref:NAD(P)-binding domain-containing protein n=1 Tax=Brucella pituitosa TaxID=571256 RepID=UPI001FFE67BC|nr:NAD(P)-binding domain-containing protein [Brucella pituitosa]
MPISQVKTIGILGAGRVGTAIARRAIAAGMRCDWPSKTPEDVAIDATMVPCGGGGLSAGTAWP